MKGRGGGLVVFVRLREDVSRMKITFINNQNHAILTLENIVNMANKSGNRMGEEGGGNERQGEGG